MNQTSNIGHIGRLNYVLDGIYVSRSVISYTHRFANSNRIMVLVFLGFMIMKNWIEKYIDMIINGPLPTIDENTGKIIMVKSEDIK